MHKLKSVLHPATPFVNQWVVIDGTWFFSPFIDVRAFAQADLPTWTEGDNFSYPCRFFAFAFLQVYITPSHGSSRRTEKSVMDSRRR